MKPLKNEQGARVMEEKLEELRKDWLVSLENAGLAGDWILRLRKQYGEREHVYRGTLRSVVSRAHAGEPT
jgi:hypothetical protein